MKLFTNLSVVFAQKQRTTVIVASVLIGLLMVAAFFTYTISRTREATERNIAAKNLMSDTSSEAYTDISGETFDIKAYTTKPLVVTSFASWCPQCVDELMLLSDVMDKAGDNAIPVLAINRREPKEVAARFISTLTNVPKITFIVDTTDYFFIAAEGYAMPETIIYNEMGEKIFHGHGNTNREALEAALASLAH